MSFWKELPGWAKGVIAVTATAAIAFGGWKTYQFIKIRKDSLDSKKASDAAGDEYKRLGKSDTLSLPNASYESAANTIFNLLDGCDSSSSEMQVVTEIIKVVKKPIDWYYLIKVFGTRNVADCGWGKTDYDLVTLLKDQLDTLQVAYSINVQGYKAQGAMKDGDTILADYLGTIGISF